MPDFESVLDKKPSDIEKPKPKPLGTYTSITTGLPELRTMPNKQGGEDHKICSFKIKVQVPGHDVDQQQLAAAGDPTLWPAFSWDIFYGTPEGEWALRSFLTDVLQIDPGKGKDEKSIREMLAETGGRQLTIALKHDPYTSKTGEAEIATRIASCAKA